MGCVLSQVVPWGLRKLLAWIKDKYDNVPVFITENGFPDSGQLDDVRRSQYIVVSSNYGTSARKIYAIISRFYKFP